MRFYNEIYQNIKYFHSFSIILHSLIQALNVHNSLIIVNYTNKNILSFLAEYAQLSNNFSKRNSSVQRRNNQIHTWPLLESVLQKMNGEYGVEFFLGLRREIIKDSKIWGFVLENFELCTWKGFL